MIEYIGLILVVLGMGTLATSLGFNAAWLLIPLVILTLPSVFAMFSGSPFLATERETVNRMLVLADIQPGEIVVDLGSGDGRIVRAATKMGAYAIGYEISIYLYLLARIWGGATFRYQNYWEADLRNVDVVFIYLEARCLPRFEREIWPQLKPGCRVISNTFCLPTILPTLHDGLDVFRYDKVGKKDH